MAKLNTAAEARAFWIAQAERYERKAQHETDTFGLSLWQQRAAEARAKAATYTA